MSVTDFVFGGKSPPNSPATGGNTNVPQWMSDFQMEMVNRANTLANDPYQAYPGPRVAPASADQTGAWNQIRANQGKYDPAFKGALSTASGVMGGANPYFNSAASNIGGSTGTFTGNTVGQYMNPYEQQVIQRGADLATRNFNENMLPQLNSMFVGSGQFGSSPNAAVAFRGARDVTQNIQDTAGAQLAGAYDTGQGAFQADKSRQLGAGQAYGALGSNYGALGLNAARTQGDVATQAQNAGYQDTSQLAGAGADQRAITQQSTDQAYQDFINQRDYQWNQLARAQQVGQGTGPVSSDWSYTGPSKVYGASPAGVGLAGAAANQGIQAMGAAKGGLMRAPVKKARGGLTRVLASKDIPAWLREAIQIDMQEHRRGH